MKKILFIVPSMIGGGVERCLLNILSRLDLKKYSVTVLAIMSGGALEQQIPEGIRYRYCWKRNFSIFGKRIPGTDRLFLWLFRYLPSKLLHRLFVKETFDTEIDYWGQEGLKLVLGSQKNTKKIVFTHFDMNTENMRRSYFPYANHEQLRKAYLSVDIIANVSEDCKKSMIDRFSFNEQEQQRLIISYNVNLNNQIIEKANEPIDQQRDGVFTFCACGRLHPTKGFDRLIRICKTLVDEGYTFRLWILGSGEEEEHLRNLIVQLNLQKTVQLLGFCSNPYKYMFNADAFVCSSYSEGFSTVVSEAVILGIPTISTNCTGAKEILGNSVYGLVTDMDDESLCNGMRTFLSDRSRYETYRKMVLERQTFFDTDIRMHEFTKLL